MHRGDEHVGFVTKIVHRHTERGVTRTIVAGWTPSTPDGRDLATERTREAAARALWSLHQKARSHTTTAPPPLADAARAAGYEPETEEGGRAMMQAITPEHLRHAEAVRKMRTLKPGDEIEYTNFTVGGSYKGKAVVTWDHGKSVEVRTLPAGERVRLERASDGSLRRFT